MSTIRCEDCHQIRAIEGHHDCPAISLTPTPQMRAAVAEAFERPVSMADLPRAVKEAIATAPICVPFLPLLKLKTVTEVEERRRDYNIGRDTGCEPYWPAPGEREPTHADLLASRFRDLFVKQERRYDDLIEALQAKVAELEPSVEAPKIGETWLMSVTIVETHPNGEMFGVPEGDEADEIRYLPRRRFVRRVDAGES